MCRGCDIKIKGESATYEYLEWFDEYLKIVRKMKELNKKLLQFENIIDDNKKVIGRFRRQLIRLQREYAKADKILNNVRGEIDETNNRN